MYIGIVAISLLVAMTNTSPVSAFTVGGTFLSTAEKAALEKTAEAVATPGKGITGM
ncbi:MAG: hypothetical protein ACI8RD_012272 [Bacillariaceae sp.]|jgi:hypothetical protein